MPFSGIRRGWDQHVRFRFGPAGQRVGSGVHDEHGDERRAEADDHDQWDKALWIRGERRPTRTHYRKRADYRMRLGAFEWELEEDLHPDVFVAGHARWKLVALVDSTQGQLFDLDADPDELTNLWDAAEPEAASAKRELLDGRARWRARSAIHTAEMMREHR